MRLNPLFLAATLMVGATSTMHNAVAFDVDPGALDRPLPVTGNEKPGKPGVTVETLQPTSLRVTDPITAQQQLREEVIEEQAALEKLNRRQLEQKAESGERAAQVVLGAEFAKEASLLAFAPAAANDALSDAARWYSLAASRGYPGAPSLDLSGIRFYPIRIQRDPRP